MRLRALGAIGIGLLALLPGARAASQELDAPPEPDWIPSLAVGVELYDFESEGSVDGVLNSEDTLHQLLVTVGGELAGPAFASLPGRPRLFLGGGIGIPTETATATLDVGDPANPANPEQDIEAYLNRLDTAIGRNCREIDGRECPEPKVEEFRGQGADIRIDLDDPTWFANLGASFEIPIFEDALVQVRPSVAYRGEKVEIAGRLTQVTLDAFDLNIPPGGCTPADPCTEPPTVEFSILRSRTEPESTTYHYLGPRLELGVVLSRRARPIRTTVYVEGSFLWLLSDPSKTIVDSDGLVSYTVHRNETSIRGGIGIRFSWLGGLGPD